MTREYFDKKDASDAEKIGDALFLRPRLLRRQFNGQSRLSRNTRKTASNRRFQGAKEPLGASRKSQQRTMRTALRPFTVVYQIALRMSRGLGVLT